MAVISDDDAQEPREDRAARVRELVGSWLTLREVGDLTGRSLNQVRKMISDGEITAVRVGPGGPHVPAAFFEDKEPLPSIKGTLSVLKDGGMDDLEAVEWLFTPDDTLPVPGTPVTNLAGGFKTEMRRRAMELAF